MRTHLKDLPLRIDREEFQVGYSLFVFNLTPSSTARPHPSFPTAIETFNEIQSAPCHKPAPSSFMLVKILFWKSIPNSKCWWPTTKPQLPIKPSLPGHAGLSDQLPAHRWWFKLPIWLIMNTHPGDWSWEHWLALTRREDRKASFVFYSFGFPPNFTHKPESIYNF